MKRHLKTAAALSLAAALAACSATSGPKETGGTLIGAGLGALAGSQFGHGKGRLAAVGLGTLLGALAGQSLGASLDRADRRRAAEAAQYSLEATPSGTTTAWHNPDSDNSGTITPGDGYRAPDGAYCREFQQTVTIGGRREDAYGTACRQPDGSWRIITP